MSLDIIHEILTEREKQRDQWGDAHDDEHSAHDWVAYIVRYLGKGVYQNGWHNTWRWSEFRKAMVIVAALAIAAIEAIDRNDT